MATSSTTFKAGENTRRGKSFKNKLMAAIEKASLIDLQSGESTEEAFLRTIATRAFDSKDAASPALLKELLSKSYPALKATYPTIEFDFAPDAPPSEQVMQLMEAASKGLMPPDVATTFIHAVKAAVDIEAATDLKERIEQLEKMLSV